MYIMRMKQVADRLNKHDNTLRNWADWYAEFLSPAPPKGEVRHFTDDDFRVLAFVNDLSDKGLNKAAIHEALKEKQNSGTPYPPVNPALLVDDEPGQDVEVALMLREAQTQLAIKEAEVQKLSAQVSELRDRLDYIKDMHESDRAEFNKRYDELMERYMNLSERLGSKHSAELVNTALEIGQLRQQVQSANALYDQLDKERERHREAEEALKRTVEELNEKLSRLNGQSVKDEQ
jgi:DNA-binding transcriptional MerR regulator